VVEYTSEIVQARFRPILDPVALYQVPVTAHDRAGGIFFRLLVSLWCVCACVRMTAKKCEKSSGDAPLATGTAAEKRLLYLVFMTGYSGVTSTGIKDRTGTLMMPMTIVKMVVGRRSERTEGRQKGRKRQGREKSREWYRGIENTVWRVLENRPTGKKTH
jgi:hypothetical protein